jgi:hypothetical protein
LPTQAGMATDICIIKSDAPQTMWKEFGIQAKMKKVFFCWVR